MDPSTGESVAVLAVDPGSVHTGLCIRRGSQVLVASTIDRALGDRHPDGVLAYIVSVVAEIDGLLRWCSDKGLLDGLAGVYLAMETLRPRDPKRGDVWGPKQEFESAESAVILGAVSGRWLDPWPVAPAKHDERADADRYPPELIGRKSANPVSAKWPPSAGGREHQRSAYNVGGHAYLRRLKEGGLGEPQIRLPLQPGPGPLVVPAARLVANSTSPKAVQVSTKEWRTLLVSRCDDLDPRDELALAYRIADATAEAGWPGPWPGTDPLPLEVAVGFIREQLAPSS